MSNRAVVLNLQGELEIIPLQELTELSLLLGVVRLLDLVSILGGRACGGCLILVLLVLIVGLATLVDPRDEQSSLVPVMGELCQKVLGLGLMECLVELVLVHVQQSAAGRGQVEINGGEILLAADILGASLATRGWCIWLWVLHFG
jgi:hypothetical protein